MEKAAWSGLISAVQRRICLLQSFDERSRSYQGYVLRVEIKVEFGFSGPVDGKACRAQFR